MRINNNISLEEIIDIYREFIDAYDEFLNKLKNESQIMSVIHSNLKIIWAMGFPYEKFGFEPLELDELKMKNVYLHCLKQDKINVGFGWYNMEIQKDILKKIGSDYQPCSVFLKISPENRELFGIWSGMHFYVDDYKKFISEIEDECNVLKNIGYNINYVGFDDKLSCISKKGLIQTPLQ